jgi:hypothetical protein
MKVAQTSKVPRQHKKETVTGEGCASAQIYFPKPAATGRKSKDIVSAVSLASLFVRLYHKRTPGDASSRPCAKTQNAQNANESLARRLKPREVAAPQIKGIVARAASTSGIICSA